MEPDFVRQRRDHLDTFVKQLAKYNFLVDSFEFSIFVQHSGAQLQRQFRALLPETPEQILEKYQRICPIDINAMAKHQKTKCL